MAKFPQKISLRVLGLISLSLVWLAAGCGATTAETCIPVIRWRCTAKGAGRSMNGG